MLTAEQLARRISRELGLGGTRCDRSVLPSNLRAVVERDFSPDAQLVTHGAPKALRLISPLGVIDIDNTAWILREVPPGVSAAEVQSHVSVPLLCGPGLVEISVD